MTGLALFQHIIVWLPLVLLGVWLIRAGLRGRRINDHPICRRCRFDLVGLTGPAPDSRPDRCPECGAPLTGTARRARRAIIDGERRKRWRTVAIGTVLLFAGLGTGFWLTYKPLAKFPWTTWAPDWLLVEMVDSSTLTTADLVSRELLQRGLVGTLSKNGARRAATSLLRRHADANASWSGTMGDVLEMMHAKGVLQSDLFNAYASRCVTITARVRPAVAVNRPLPWEVVLAFRAGRGASFPSPRGTQTMYVSVSPLSVTFDDGTVVDATGGLMQALVSTGGSPTLGGEFNHGGAAGRHRAVIRVRCDVRARLLENAADTLEPVARIETDVPVQFEVVETVRTGLVVDESRREQMRAAFKVDPIIVRPSTESGERISLRIAATNPPITYAFDVDVVIDGKHWNAGSISGAAGPGQTGFAPGRWEQVDRPISARAAIVLKPSARGAEHRRSC